MPQPLSRVANKSLYHFASRQASYGVRQPVFRGHEKFGLLAMECLAEWAYVEMDIVMLFSRLSGGPMRDAFQIYAALDGDGPKGAVLNAMAQLKIRPNDLALFHAVRKLSRSCRDGRNKIAHWTWGFFSERDDAILLVHPIDLINRTTDLDLSKVEVWFVNDFTDLAQRMRVLGTCYSLMSSLSRGDHRERDETAELLSRTPEIQALLNPPHP